MNRNVEEEGATGTLPGNGEHGVFDDGQTGRIGEIGRLDCEAPEGNSAEGGSGAVGQGCVYFVETEDRQYVKIGYSVQPYRRLSQLGTLRPGNHALRMIGWMPGTVQTEHWIHGKFSAQRDNGEWFRDSEQLRQFIAAMGLIKPDKPGKKAAVVVDVTEMGRKGGSATAAARTPAERKISAMAEKRSIGAEPVSAYLAEIGRRGGQVKGRKGAAVLSPAERKERATKMATARWGKAKRG